MYSSTGSAPAQQVPAWKRLGLKLKQPSGSAASESAPAGPTGGVGHPSSPVGKRKLDAPPPANSSQVAKRPRRDETQTTNGHLRKQKSVTFADTPTKYGNTPTSVDAKTSKTVPPKKSKGPAKKQTPPVTDFRPALEYLRLWKNARDSWKFNKNHQASLIKHVFDAEKLPSSDIESFYDYIQDLKGFTRMRLRDSALEIRVKDQADGKAGFPEKTKDVAALQERYETILARFLDTQRGQKRKGFVEAEYSSDSDDGEIIIQRLVKRLRAELVLDELSDSGDSAQTDTSTTSSSSSATVTASDNATSTATSADKKMKLNDGSVKRKRKLRTANDDDSSSSSESESDNDSGASSSDSSSEEESSDDEEEATAELGDGYDTSSSSSSSSSSESEAEDDSDDEDSD